MSAPASSTADKASASTTAATTTAAAAEDDVPQPLPNLALQQLHFQILAPRTTDAQRKEYAEELLKGIEADEMAPYLSALLAGPAGASLPARARSLVAPLEAKNVEALRLMDEAQKRLEDNEGEMEVNAVRRQRAKYLARIGDKERALEAHTTAIEKAAGLGSRLDLTLAQIRIGLFHGDASVTTEGIARAKEMVEEGGDWDRRNRLKVYEGLHLLSIRQFKQGGELFLDALSTFTATELLSYNEFVTLTVLANMLSLERRDIKKKIIESPEVLQVIDEIPHLRTFTTSLYACDYSTFFVSLASVEQTHLLPSRVLSAHTRWYVRAMRVLAYTQLLASYSSVTLKAMAEAFGVSEAYIDEELARFIAAGRISAAIDRVSGTIETRRSTSTTAAYERVLKEGDVTLSSLQKLSRTLVG